ncbi:MAG TPA: hypothetical protein VFQ61_05495, partial [Polyangiaceae bacterium]|nr:hypothetical protein [Polyangiaceae bacterium]
GSDNFSFLVPQLPNAVITVAASYGDPGFGEAFSLAHQDVSPGQANIQLALPAPAVLTAPMASASAVNSNTIFRWVSDDKVFLLHVVDADEYRELFVLTSSKQIKLPSIAGEFPLRPAADHFWSVQVHGTWPSVDAAAGAEGFQDPFGIWQGDPDGLGRGDGVFSQSEIHDFTTSANP